MPNPLLGVFFHWLGGLASASFYVPYRGVRGWSWEIFWLVGGLFSWVFAPWLFAAVRTHDLFAVLAAAPPRTLALCYFFSQVWLRFALVKPPSNETRCNGIRQPRRSRSGEELQPMVCAIARLFLEFPLC